MKTKINNPFVRKIPRAFGKEEKKKREWKTDAFIPTGGGRGVKDRMGREHIHSWFSVYTCVCVCRFNHQTNWEGDAHRKWWKAKKSFLNAVSRYLERGFSSETFKTAAVRENEIIPLIFFVFFVKDKPTSSFIVQTRNKKNVRGMYDNEILTSLSGRPNQHKDR